GPQGVLEQRVDLRGKLKPVCDLVAARAFARVAQGLWSSVAAGVPCEAHARLLCPLERRDGLGPGDQGEADRAGRDVPYGAMDEPLWCIATDRGVERAPRLRAQAIGEHPRWI